MTYPYAKRLVAMVSLTIKPTSVFTYMHVSAVSWNANEDPVSFAGFRFWWKEVRSVIVLSKDIGC